MIIIGYQGIGKSTLSGFGRFVDLESTNFRIDGVKPPDWYKPYGNVALDLSRQGFIVFTASHASTREWLGTQNKTNETIAVCYPSPSLKEQWVERLQKRYDVTRLQKDFYALENAKERYSENVIEIRNDAIKYDWKILELTSMDYSLKEIIEKFVNENKL